MFAYTTLEAKILHDFRQRGWGGAEGITGFCKIFVKEGLRAPFISSMVGLLDQRGPTPFAV